VVEGESLPPGEDRFVIIEIHLDDISGEVIGYAVERLFAEGAVDVFVTPAFGKKNRPVNVVSVMAAAGDEDRLIRVLMEETGTLGVRVHEFRKVVADREKETVPVNLGGRVYPVRVKTSTIKGRLITEKPEYDDLSAIARERRAPPVRGRGGQATYIGMEKRACQLERGCRGWMPTRPPRCGKHRTRRVSADISPRGNVLLASKFSHVTGVIVPQDIR